MTIKSDKYYGLRLISLLCKAITIISVLIGIGVVGANIINLLNQNPRPRNIDLLQIWASESVGILLVIGGMGFIFFIISQIIDVQMAINTKLNTIADVVKSMDNIVDALEKTETTETPDIPVYSNHKEIMQTLNRQTRMLSKMYQDLVEDKDNAKVNIEVE